MVSHDAFQDCCTASIWWRLSISEFYQGWSHRSWFHIQCSLIEFPISLQHCEQNKCNMTTVSPIKLPWETTAQLLLLSSAHVMHKSWKNIWHVFSRREVPIVTHLRAHRGAALIWGAQAYTHTHTPHLYKTHSSSSRRVPRRFRLPHFSYYQAVWISLCMELLWLLVRSSWSQRQRPSPKCVRERRCSVKCLITNCFITLPTRVFINF